MTTANPETGAESIEVTDVESATQALLARDTDNQEVIESEAEQEEAADVEETSEAETEEESDDSPETEDDGTDEREAEEESEDPQFHSIDELAEALELTPEDFRNQITAKVKINGEEKEVSLDELANGYQFESATRQKTMELAEQRRAFEEETEKQRSELNNRVQEAANLTANLEAQILGEYNNVDWNSLRATDPAEYAAMQADYQHRYNAVQQMKGQTTQEAQKLQAEQMAKQEQSRNELLKKESEALMSAIPEWKDSDTANKEKAEMRDFLKAYNFSDNEIAQLADHRIVMMIRDAQKGKKVATKSDVAKKKVIKAPKLQKPGAKPSKQNVQSQKLKDLKSKVRKSGGKVDDVAALLLARS